MGKFQIVSRCDGCKNPCFSVVVIELNGMESQSEHTTVLKCDFNDKCKMKYLYTIPYTEESLCQ